MVNAVYAAGMKREIKVALIQMSMTPDLAANVAKAATRVEESAANGAQVVCLPELFRSLYFCQTEDPALFDLAESLPGPTTERFGELAAKLGVVLVVPVFERRAAGVYHNSAAIIDADGSLAAVYRKMHVPDDPAYYEKYYFAPGDLGFNAADTRYGRIAVLICWDQWYPEAARLAALRGAEIVFYPTAIGWHPREKAALGSAQRDAWRTVQRGHAIANGVYVAAVNRVGHEKPGGGGEGIEFWGTSFLADPQGVVLCEASDQKEDILYASADLGRIEDIRRAWPFLRDRRIDAYEGISERFLDPNQNITNP